MTALLSDELKATRDRLKDFRHGGIAFSGEEVERVIRRFNTFIELALDIEEELRFALRRRRAEIGETALIREIKRPGSNVVALIADRPGRHGDGDAE